MRLAFFVLLFRALQRSKVDILSCCNKYTIKIKLEGSIKYLQVQFIADFRTPF